MRLNKSKNRTKRAKPTPLTTVRPPCPDGLDQRCWLVSIRVSNHKPSAIGREKLRITLLDGDRANARVTVETAQWPLRWNSWTTTSEIVPDQRDGIDQRVICIVRIPLHWCKYDNYSILLATYVYVNNELDLPKCTAFQCNQPMYYSMGSK
jgi:hypothetical protein